MMIHIDRNGERMGPYSLEDVNRYLADGTLQPSDLGWYDGATDWAPLTNIEGVVAAGAAPPPTSGSTCPNCRVPVEANQVVCVECGTRLQSEPVAAMGSKKALFISLGVAGVVALAVGSYFIFKGDDEPSTQTSAKKDKDSSNTETDDKSTTQPPAKPPAKPEGQTSGTQKGDIFKAVSEGNLEALKLHIAAGTDLNQRSPEDQSTPLMIGALFGQAEAAKALIEAGAKLDLKKNDGGTALMNAAFLCHPEIVQALLDKGADKNIRNNTGTTALQSVEGPFISVKFFYDIINGLVFQPAGIPLDYDRIKATRPKIAKMLGGSGGNVAGNNGQAMDIFSILKPGNEEALKKLIASRADLNVKGPLGTPLAVAAVYGNTASVMLLINGGANVNAAGNDGGTALHAAAFMCRTDIVKALLAKGANVNARKPDGQTALSTSVLPWQQVQGFYLLVGGLFQISMDQAELQRIQNTRPQIAQILRQAGAQ